MIEIKWPKYFNQDNEIMNAFESDTNKKALQEYNDAINKIENFDQEIIAVTGPMYIYKDFIDVTIILVNTSQFNIANIGIDLVLIYQDKFISGGFLLMEDKYGEISSNSGIVEFFRVSNQGEFSFEQGVVEKEEYQIKANISYQKYEESKEINKIESTL